MDEKKVKVRSLQPNVKASHFGDPTYEIHFEDNEPILMSEKIADHLVKDNPGMFQKVGAASKVKNDFEEEVKEIKGIGTKSAKDIVTLYPNKQDLLRAIKEGSHIPLDDNIANILLEKYGGES